MVGEDVKNYRGTVTASSGDFRFILQGSLKSVKSVLCWQRTATHMTDKTFFTMSDTIGRANLSSSHLENGGKIFPSAKLNATYGNTDTYKQFYAEYLNALGSSLMKEPSNVTYSDYINVTDTSVATTTESIQACSFGIGYDCEGFAEENNKDYKLWSGMKQDNLLVNLNYGTTATACTLDAFVIHDKRWVVMANGETIPYC